MKKIAVFIFLSSLSVWSLVQRPRYRGEYKSTIEWETQDSSDFLDFSLWKRQLEDKESTRSWFDRQHDLLRSEQVGVILKCVGECHLYRGVNFVQTQFRSPIYEGDVLETQKNSAAWILLVDGSLIRLSAFSSLAMNEINFSEEKIFYYMRLNEGHMYWKSRAEETLPVSNLSETDQIFLPLMVGEANTQAIERKIFQDPKKKQEALELRLNPSKINELHYQAYNELINENSNFKQVRKTTTLFLSSVLSSFKLSEPHFHYLYVLGGEGYFKLKNDVSSKEKSLYLTDSASKENESIEQDSWYTIASNGTKLTKNEKPQRELNQFELLVKRIPSILIAREILIKKYRPLFRNQKKIKLATQLGYRLWKEENLLSHEGFLLKHSGRTEPLNLMSLRKLISGYENKIGETPIKTLTDNYNQWAVLDYFKELSGKQQLDYSFVKHYSDSEYYLWLLHYAKNKH